MLKTVTAWLLFACLAISTSLVADEKAFPEKSATPELFDQLQKGGYVLYLRHGKTDSSKPDEVPVALDDCNSQRPLTAEGKEQMAFIGQALQALQLPLDPIISSPFCRAQESTAAAFGPDSYSVEKLLMYTAALTSEEKKPVLETTRELISLPQPAGSNRVLVAHGPNLAEIMRYFPPEGSLVIFKPLGQGEFEYLASVLPDQWSHLLAAKGLAHELQP
ncbi:histidine phosphatase family protein [Marinospirillum sp.]|uniref:histidine phosphatase family protein n=1 Tax=Marinospirillum sp. TaxID=2183934 RepID=UPI00286FB965|nr:histidine phosphatase family protein [Marinospirillum sp.]MDR9467499.1 histidine phosphatase family protein [Marinospirillum sp.]